jgi:hypothetical protein
VSRKFFALLMLGMLAVGAASFSVAKAGTAGDCGAPAPCDGCVPGTGCDGCGTGCDSGCSDPCEDVDSDCDADSDCDSDCDD